MLDLSITEMIRYYEDGGFGILIKKDAILTIVDKNNNIFIGRLCEITTSGFKIDCSDKYKCDIKSFSNNDKDLRITKVDDCVIEYGKSKNVNIMMSNVSFIDSTPIIEGIHVEITTNNNIKYTGTIYGNTNHMILLLNNIILGILKSDIKDIKIS